MTRWPLRYLALALALTNAILYSCVLPLWEGFDEPLHYGYVESISVAHRFPVFRETRLAANIRKSLALVPISWLLNKGLGGGCTSFEEWFALPAQERLRREHELAALPPELKLQPSDIMNWEAQQAPLAYLLLAPVDAALASVPLRTRILLLRFFGAIVATMLIYFCLAALLGGLGVSDGLQFVVLACVFESQMLWASIAHVSNDWLAIALTFCFLTALAGVARDGDGRRVLLLAVLFSMGLLTKAYFLAFAPVFVAVVVYGLRRAFINWNITAAALAIPVVIDGPWYVHNVLRYGSVTGTQQSMAGIGIAQAIAAIPRIDWVASTVSFVRWSLWTGNWSFVSFSRATLDIEALLLCASLILYLVHYRRIGGNGSCGF